jgi:IS30 family transposase
MGRHYSHLSLDERRRIAKWLEAKMPIAEMADRLCRDASTIYRDIKRNRYKDSELPELDGYHAVAAQDMYERRRAIHRKMIVFPELKVAIEDRLKAGWSPGQIAGRMRLERHPIRVSHETIYRFAYSKDGREEQFTAISPNIADAADRAGTAGTTAPGSLTARACHIGLTASQSARSLGIGSAT